MKPYGSKRSYDTEPRMKSGRALVKREGREIAEEMMDDNANESILVHHKALVLRDACIEEMARVAADEDLVADMFDPGDAHVDIAGNPYNVLTVLNILDAIGVMNCK